MPHFVLSSMHLKVQVTEDVVLRMSESTVHRINQINIIVIWNVKPFSLIQKDVPFYRTTLHHIPEGCKLN